VRSLERARPGTEAQRAASRHFDAKGLAIAATAIKKVVLLANNCRRDVKNASLMGCMAANTRRIPEDARLVVGFFGLVQRNAARKFVCFVEIEEDNVVGARRRCLPSTNIAN